MTLFASSDSNSAVSGSFTDRPAAVRPCHTIVGRLRGVNGNSLGARRLREVATTLADDLGGVGRLSEPVKIQIRQAAALTVEAEQLQARIARGDPINHENLIKNREHARPDASAARAQKAAAQADQSARRAFQPAASTRGRGMRLRKLVTMREALDERRLFRPAARRRQLGRLARASDRNRWRATDRSRAGHLQWPHGPRARAAGARRRVLGRHWPPGGKTRSMAVLAGYLAACVDHRDALAPGERGVIPLLAASTHYRRHRLLPSSRASLPQRRTSRTSLRGRRPTR